MARASAAEFAAVRRPDAGPSFREPTPAEAQDAGLPAEVVAQTTGAVVPSDTGAPPEKPKSRRATAAEFTAAPHAPAVPPLEPIPAPGFIDKARGVLERVASEKPPAWSLGEPWARRLEGEVPLFEQQGYGASAGLARTIAGFSPSRIPGMVAGALAHPIEAGRGMVEATGIPQAAGVLAGGGGVEKAAQTFAEALAPTGGLGPAMLGGAALGAGEMAARGVARLTAPRVRPPAAPHATPSAPATGVVDFDAIAAENAPPTAKVTPLSKGVTTARKPVAGELKPPKLRVNLGVERPLSPEDAAAIAERRLGHATASPIPESPPPRLTGPAPKVVRRPANKPEAPPEPPIVLTPEMRKVAPPEPPASPAVPARPATTEAPPAPSAVPEARVAPAPAEAVPAPTPAMDPTTGRVSVAPETPPPQRGGLPATASTVPEGPNPPPAAGGVRLPRELAGAKPRYSYGRRQFTEVVFDSDVDRALYIVAQKTPSKADAAYMDFLRRARPGVSDADLRAGGAVVRERIKALAKAAPTGETTLRVPRATKGKMGPERGASSLPGDIATSFANTGRAITEAVRKGTDAVLDAQLVEGAEPGHGASLREAIRAAPYLLNRPKALVAEGHTPEFVGRATISQYPRAVAQADGVVEAARKFAGWDDMPAEKRQAMTRYFDARRWMTEEQRTAADARASADPDFARVKQAVDKYLAEVQPVKQDSSPGLPMRPGYSPTRGILKGSELEKSLAANDPDALPRAAAQGDEARTARRARITREGYTRKAAGGDYGAFHQDLFDSMREDAYSAFVLGRRNAFIREAVKTGRALSEGKKGPVGVYQPREMPAEGKAEWVVTKYEAKNAHQAGLDLPEGSRFEVTPTVAKMLAEYREPVEVTAKFWKAWDAVNGRLATLGVSSDLAGAGLNVNQMRRAVALSPNPVDAAAAVARGALKGLAREGGAGTNALRGVLSDEQFRRLAQMDEHEAANLMELARSGVSTAGGIAPGEVMAPGSKITHIPWVDMFIDFSNRVQSHARPAIQSGLMDAFRRDKGGLQRALEKVGVPEAVAGRAGRAVGERPTLPQDLVDEVTAIVWDPFGKDATPGARAGVRRAFVFPGAKGSQFKAALNAAKKRPGGIAARIFLGTQIMQYLVSLADPDPEKRGHFTWDNEIPNAGVTRIELPFKTPDGKGRYGVANPLTGAIGIPIRASGIERYFADAITTGEPVKAAGRTAQQLPRLALTEGARALTPMLGGALDLAGQRFGGQGKPLFPGARTIGNVVQPLSPFISPNDPNETLGMRALQSGASFTGLPPPMIYRAPGGVRPTDFDKKQGPRRRTR